MSKLANRILYFEDCSVSDFVGNYEDFCRYQKNRQLSEKDEMKTETVSSSKESYLQNKREQAEARKNERKLRLAKEEAEKLEKQLEIIEVSIEEAATDYVISAELWEEKEKLEARLLELYEMIGI